MTESSPELPTYPNHGQQERVGEAIGTLLNLDITESVHATDKLHTKPIITLSMGDNQSVGFTSLEHYAPQMHPSTEAATHPLPPYISSMVEKQYRPSTYEKTIEQEGWSKQLFDQVFDYLKTDPAGARLVQDLKIDYLDDLTPEQAVKVSVGTVQGLSKYSYDQTELDGNGRADNLTTMELLQEGRARQNDKEWTGNGVCRNIAANISAVFQGLKDNQADKNRLRNTYVVTTQGYDGDGYSNTFNDPSSSRPIGHAWNTFVTVDAHGSTNMTIVDSTNALGKELQDNDVTMQYMAKQMGELFDHSNDKVRAFGDLTYYYKRLAQSYIGKPKARQAAYQFIANEYLAAASKVVDELPDDEGSVPSEVIHGIAQLGDKLDEYYVRTLYRLDEKGYVEDSEHLIQRWLKSDTTPASTYQKLSFIERSPADLQAVAFNALGPEKSAELASRSKEVDKAYQQFTQTIEK